MKRPTLVVIGSLLPIVFLMGTSTLFADTFGSGENALEIEFVTVGSPGNADNVPIRQGFPPEIGGVDEVYRIGKYEVPHSAVVAANELGGLAISLSAREPQQPASGISWLEAARFTNWLNVDAGYPEAYKFSDSGESEFWVPGDIGFDPENLLRNSRAFYFLPTVDEWYKAGAYDPIAKRYYRYATGSDIRPTAVSSGTDPGTVVSDFQDNPADITLAGGESPYGTVGQTGNIGEWLESASLVDPANRFIASDFYAGSFSEIARLSTTSRIDIGGASDGIRVASRFVPEPHSILLLSYLSLMISLFASRKRS